jgi:hypothetical protein
MKNSIKLPLFILTVSFLSTLLVSCSHQPVPERRVAAVNCWDSVKGEYQSYFDSVEKCIEKQSDKQ